MHQSIRVLKRKDIEIHKWDLCVAQSEFNVIYGLSWYLDHFTDHNWEAFVLGDYQSVLPFFSKKKLLLAYITQPFLCQYFQVYGDKSQETLLLDHALNHFRNRYVKVSFNIKTLSSAVSFPSYDIVAKECQCLYLNAPYAALRRQYQRNTIRNLNAPVGAAFQINKESDTNLVNFVITHDPSGLLAQQKALVTSFCQVAMDEGDAYFYVAKEGDDILGIGFFIETATYILFMLSAMNARGRSWHATYRIVDFLISEKAQSGKILDFGGSSIPSIARRNLSFGSESLQYLFLSRRLL